MNDVLAIALDAAVPLLLAELQAMTATQREGTRVVWAREAADAVAHQGDVLQYGSKRKGEAAKVFNHLARGLAAAAYQPGGITFAGRHWEVTGADPVASNPTTPQRRAVVDALRSL